MKKIINPYEIDNNIFETFISHIGERTKLLNILYSYISDKLDNKKQIDILDIGSGNGFYEDLICKEFYSENKEINFTLIEPSKLISKSYYLSKEYPNFKFEFMNNDVEKLGDSLCETFDFILSFHSLYYIPDWKQLYSKIISLLNKTGISFILIRSKFSDVFKLKMEVLKNIDINKKLYGEKLLHYLETKKEVFEYIFIENKLIIPSSEVYTMSSNELCNVALQIGYFYLYRDKVNFNINKLKNFFLRYKFNSDVVLNLVDILIICHKK